MNLPIGYLSLRWKALIVLSVILVLVNGSLAFLVYRQSARQFELQQVQLRNQQTRQFQALLDDGYRQMARLANLAPLVGSDGSDPDLDARLRRAIGANGFMLDLEWDIRSVHWIKANGATTVLWPAEATALPVEVSAQFRDAPEHTQSLMSCGEECRLYLAAPLLEQGQFAGTLVLGRSLADALLTFNALTDADAVVIASGTEPTAATSANQRRFPAMTHQERLDPILRQAGFTHPGRLVGDAPLLIHLGGDWFELFRLATLVPRVEVFAINQVTAQQKAVVAAIRNSLLLGLMGLLLSEILLLLVIQAPLAQLRRLAQLLPLLAENQYQQLRARLPILGRSPIPRDEMDLIIETVGSLTERMEQLQQDREHAENRLGWLASHDPLTKLCNRRQFNADFTRVFDQALRYDRYGALLFFDLDQFKDVNDSSGHPVGDQLLEQIAQKLQQMARKSDLLARFGGDEFVLAIPEASVEQAITVAERLQEAVRSVVLHERDRRHQVSASIGIALFPNDGEEPEQVIANADLAMYQAKSKGRGRAHLFSAEDQAREQADSRVLWKEKIADALAENRFELHCQPIFEIRAGKVSHMEALLRMRDPAGRLVYPNQFIPVAEQTGLIQAIDHWVLTRAIAIMQAHPGLRLSVNLSANALDDPLLLSDLEAQLSRQCVDPDRVTFEITETVAISSLCDAARLMRSVHKLGCRFALDDFGSGFASYAYLRQLPVDDVKIDGAFIRDLVENREDRLFVKAITDISHAMGKRVIAEFVENEAILHILGELGVDCAQGYHIGRPAPLSGQPA
ncbi:MAG: EAL domain-containing protein [Candidatus Contendobacter sp.]|nr:EAL domain-containing protein [Candidatus Contendobacter sp.]